MSKEFFPKNVVVVSPARCGSSWLMDYLSNIGYNNQQEFFRENCNLSKKYMYAQYQKLQSPFCLKLFTDEITDYSVDLNKFTNSSLWLLYRSNIIEHFVSTVVAKYTKQWNRTAGQHVVNASITLTNADYGRYAYMHRRFVNIAKYGGWNNVITYEDLFSYIPDYFGQPNNSAVVKVSTIDDKLNMFTAPIDYDRLKTITNCDDLYNFNPELKHYNNQETTIL